MAYLYRHIRLDSNSPFYIGIGEDTLSKEGSYKRAYETINRNKHWYNIINKTSYKVDIVLDNLSWDEACQKEIEFISLYGRNDLNEGNLVNLTNGGEGKKGVQDSNETKLKKSLASKGKPKTEQWKISQSISRKGKKRGILPWLVDNIERSKKISLSKQGKPSPKRRPVIQYDLDGNYVNEFDSIYNAGKYLNKTSVAICDCCNMKRKTAYGYKWQYK